MRCALDDVDRGIGPAEPEFRYVLFLHMIRVTSENQRDWALDQEHFFPEPGPGLVTIGHNWSPPVVAPAPGAVWQLSRIVPNSDAHRSSIP
jgi:peptidoglycan/xylan/chitin deacetylase (PgdA/CDA1 family)